MAEERPIFSKGQLQDVLRTRDAVKDIQNTMKAMGMDTKNVNSDFAAIGKAANSFASAQEKAKSNTRSVNQLLTKGNELIGRANKLTAEVTSKEQKRRDNLRDIQKLYDKQERTGKDLSAQEKARIKTLEAQNNELAKESQTLLDAADHTKVLGITN